MKPLITKINPEDYTRLTWLASELMSNLRTTTAKASIRQVLHAITPPDTCPQYTLPPLISGGHSVQMPDPLLYRVSWGLSATMTLRIAIAWEYDQFCDRVDAGQVDERELTLAHGIVTAYVLRKYADHRRPNADRQH